MANEWRVVRLADCCDFNPASVSASWPHRTIRYIDISSVGEGSPSEAFKVLLRTEAPSRAQRLVESGDTILSTVRPGRRSMLWLDSVEPNMVASTGFAVLRARREVIDPRYLYYTVFNPAFTAYLVTREKGAAYPAVSTEDIGSAEIPLPPLPEQKRIATILGSLDDKIELNRRMNETLEQMARALFKSWFVDFDPVHAKAAGRQPVGMDKATADLFPDSFEDSELGMVPKGWEVVSLGDEVTITRGCSYKSEELGVSQTAMVTLKSFKRGGGYRQDGLKAYTGAFKPTQVVSPGELVVSYTDVTQAAELIGRPAIVGSTEKFDKLVISQDVSVVRSTGDIPISYLYRLMMEDSFTAHTYAHSTGTTVLHLSSKALPSFKFSKPSKMLLSSFDQVGVSLQKSIETNNRQARILEAVRGTLLPGLLAGRN